MTFLPIVDRELRVRARQRSTFRFRQGGALVAILVVGLLLLVADLSSTNPNGSDLFGFLAGLAFLYGVFEGARNTADCLSEEKRAGTLGLLWLTDLRGYDIVFGKLLATSLNSFYALLAVLPPLAIPLVLGGVTAGEFWRMVLVLLSTLTCSVTSGLFVSAASRSEGRAWLGTLGLTATMCLGPGLAFRFCFDAAYQAKAQAFWLGLLPVPLLGGALLLAATRVLPRTCRDDQDSGRPSWFAWFQSTWPRAWIARHRGVRARLLLRDPARWLASREQDQPWYVWGSVALACVGVAIFNPEGPGSSSPITGRWLGSMLLVNLLLATWMAWLACQAFASARSSGILELLLTTPVTAEGWIEGHFQALRRLFLAPTVCLYAVGFFLPLVNRAVRGGSGLALVETLGMALVAALLLLFALLDLWAVAWFGLWMGLRSSKVGPALTKTVLYVLALPLPIVFCPPAMLLLCLAKDVVFMNYGREKLCRHFRALAAGESAAPSESGPVPRRRARPQALPSVWEG